MSREQAQKILLKQPEGAPFWKYNVKDEVITAPIKSYKISENPEAGHVGPVDKNLAKKIDSEQSFKCGRIKNRIEKLKNKYAKLMAINTDDRNS